MENARIALFLGTVFFLAGCIGPSYYIEESIKSTYSILPTTTIGGDILGGSEGTLYVEFRDSEGNPLDMESKYESGGNLAFNVTAWACPNISDLTEAYKEGVCGEALSCEVKSASIIKNRLEIYIKCPLTFEEVRRVDIEGSIVGKESTSLEEAKENFIFCEDKDKPICTLQLKAVLKIGRTG